MNKKADSIQGMLMLFLIIIFFIFITFLADSNYLIRNVHEQGDYYCKIKYGKGFISKYDEDLGFDYCGSITKWDFN